MTEKNPLPSDPLRLNPEPLAKPNPGREEDVKASGKTVPKKKPAKRKKR